MMELDQTLAYLGEDVGEELLMVFLTCLLDGYLAHV